jgi:DNA-binding transcriptional MerR regulator
MKADFSSGDLARATGSTVRTIRHYEDEGLLRPTVVSDGGHRRYTEDDLERLRLIGDLRELGLSLCEIKSILDLRTGCQTAAEFAARFRQAIEVHLGAAQRRLERLRRMKKEIVDSLVVVEERLRDGGAQCPCAVAVAGRVPRIVKVIARQRGCGCVEVGHAETSGLTEAGASLGVVAGEASEETEEGPIGFA